ncbi:MAG: hypothetical protein ACHQFX_11020 [Chitinophagales bacterium]
MIKRIAFILLFSCSFGAQSIAQHSSYKDSIEMVDNFFSGLRFYQHDQKLTLAGLSQVMYPNKEALKYLNKAKTNNTLGFITGIVGGFLIGYELGSLLGSNDINWAVMGTGAGLILISIPFNSGTRRNARKAVYLYNAAYR